MPNIASVLKDEIARLARKELRAETVNLQKAASTARSEIASLKRRVAELEKALKAVQKSSTKAAAKAAAAAPESETDDSAHRFRASGLANNRARLGLSAADFGLLVGTTGQSIYAWELGRSKPRAKNLVAIAALRGLGKREVAAKLAALKEAAAETPADKPVRRRRQATD
ncbi:helix-turn-helix transcriptional regulator [Paucibacter sp. R3-3]|uniref:Helix-turn-helix transcriptional regulator n=1 Tax=Roseateles agri TaxID=3098619 RepID=A0ABU5DEU2_9BURK|nr:helix-turn-helix transcriptional regulator [Paucibacter sp. R3-3]MDY0744797.1 helix-turn-helix transcriptional regulator [Paucibacter sp. R3-3]